MSSIRSLREAAGNLLVHKTRSFLAVLGIVFGVASVICMLSISEVARRDVVGRIERMGLRNVILDSVKPERIRKREEQDQQDSWIAKYGLSLQDLDVLRATLGSEGPHGLGVVSAIVPMRIMLEDVKAGAELADINVVATTPEYDEVMNHAVREGRFLTEVDESATSAVCVLGAEAARTLFPLANALEQVVQVGGVHFRVVGVMERHGTTGSIGILSNPDNTAWIPFASSFARFGRLQFRSSQGTSEAVEVELHRAVVQVAEGQSLSAVASVGRRLIDERHPTNDVTITIPHALLREHRQAENIFRWVMGSLAAISLLVGGVGIMNIMLANMAERRSEIGLRRALGATQSEILRLFVSESAVLCLTGGVLGVGLGVGLAMLVGQLAGWTVVVHPLSLPLGVAVSVATGILFGTLPAIQAARLDPVLALRVE